MRFGVAVTHVLTKGTGEKANMEESTEPGEMWLGPEFSSAPEVYSAPASD